MPIKGLWPNDVKPVADRNTSDESTPEDILQVQASDLTTKTKNMLEGRIERGSQGDWITLDFYITVPSLDDYAYHLLKVRHKVPPYPLEIISSALSKNIVRIPAENRATFESRLKSIFSSAPIRHIVQDLLLYARRSSKPPTR